MGSFSLSRRLLEVAFYKLLENIPLQVSEALLSFSMQLRGCCTQFYFTIYAVHDSIEFGMAKARLQNN